MTSKMISFGGKTVRATLLPQKLWFVRKPCCLEDVVFAADEQNGDELSVYVAEKKVLTAKEFEWFTDAMTSGSYPWLDGKGGHLGNDTVAVVQVTDGVRSIFVNPEGSDYARYAAVAN